MPAAEEMFAAQPLIHPTAVIDPRAELGSGVRVAPHAVIGPHVVVGDECVIGAHVVLDGHLTLGMRNKIFPGAVLGTEPQDLKFAGGECRVVMGNDNTIREGVTVNVATTPEESTRIGDHCLLMACSHVAHNCILGDHVIMANGALLGGHVELGDWVILGGLAGVHQFALVGAHAFIGGGSSVRLDVPPYVKASGSPMTLAGVNATGLERRGFDEAAIARIKRAYRYLYRRGLRVEEALEKIAAEGEDEIARTYRDFFARSERGSVR